MDKFMGTINTNGLAIWHYTKDLYVTTYRYILIDFGSFLEYIRVPIFIPTSLAVTAFFTNKINKLQQIIGGLKPPSPPASDGPIKRKLDQLLLSPSHSGTEPGDGFR